MIFSRKWLHLAGFIVLLLGPQPSNAQERKSSLDGVYTRPHSHINEKGEEEEVGFFQKEVLELGNGHFRYWFISDVDFGEKYPYTGSYTKEGNIISLQHEKWKRTSKRYVTMTINGIFGLWTEEGLKKWKTGKEVMYPAILVRVGDGPVRVMKHPFGADDIPDYKDFTLPSIKPLFDMKAVKAYWANKSQKSGKKEESTEKKRVENPNPFYDNTVIIAMPGVHTVLPKGSILHVPKNLKEMIVKQPKGKLIFWPEFQDKYSKWITTQEVTIGTARGEDPIKESQRKAFVDGGKIVVAVFKKMPITVLNPTPKKAVQDDGGKRDK